MQKSKAVSQKVICIAVVYLYLTNTNLLIMRDPNKIWRAESWRLRLSLKYMALLRSTLKYNNQIITMVSFAYLWVYNFPSHRNFEQTQSQKDI